MKDNSDSALRTPASKTISSPASQRLQSVTDNNRHPRGPPPIPPKSNLRNSASELSLPASVVVSPPPRDFESDKQTSSSGTAGTSTTGPPAYEWVPEPQVVDNESVVSGPVEGEKLAELRRNGGYKRRHQRGGWCRMLLLIIVICVVVIGLAIGLGVGLTVGRRKRGSQDNSGSSSSGSPSNNDTEGSGPQPFPIGEYTMLTALKDVSTDCTSNAETWTCYPRTVYDPSNPTSSASLATFNWVLKNTSTTFATMGTGPTTDQGIPANISISSTDNPLSISFTDQTLTYIASDSNSSSARLTFSFPMEKSVFPATSLTGDNMATQCYFNQTIFTGTLFLSAARNYPSDNSNSTSTSMQWPYAVEASQSSAGGEDSPACYEYMNGVNGNRVTTGLTAQPESSQCSCDYRNF